MYNLHEKSMVFAAILIIILMFIGSITGSVAGYAENRNNIEDNAVQRLMPVEATLLDDLINQNEQHEQNEIDISEITSMKVKKSGSTFEDTEMSIKSDPILESSKRNTITLPITIPSPKITLKKGYSRLDVPGCRITGNPGEPEVVTKVLNFKFKPLTEFTTIEFIPEIIVKDSLPFHLKPIQEPVPLSLLYQYSVQPPQPIKPDPSIYSVPKPFPEQWFTVDQGVGIDKETEITTLFLNIRINPVRYIPIKNEIIYTTKGTLTIEFTPPDESELNRKLYGVSTYETLNNGNTAPTQKVRVSKRSSARETNYKILIIGPELFQEDLTRLVQFKSKTNWKALYVNLSEINTGKYFTVFGRDQQEIIKYFIFNAKKAWNISYVILGGDTAKVPHRNAIIQNNPVPADLYYADLFDTQLNFCNWDSDGDDLFGEFINMEMDGTDKYPDVYVGRLPADTEAQMKILVDKIIDYESGVAGFDWFDNVTMCGHDTFKGESSGIPEGEYSCEYIYNNYLLDFNATKIYETNRYPEKDLDLTSSNIIDTLNKGSGFATFHDHGSPQTWAGVLSGSQAENLTNGKKLPFLNFDACSTGQFDDQDCIAERVVLNPKGGSITSIGASRVGYGDFGKEHINRRSGYFNVHLYSNYYNGTGTAGKTFEGSKIDYLDEIGISNFYDYITIMEYTLFGDPSLSIGGFPIWNISISCDDNTKYVVPANSVNFEVTLSNNGTLTLPIKLEARGVPANWSIEFNESVVFVPGMSDKKVTMTVTASGTALYEYIADIEVLAAFSKNLERPISVMTHSIATRIYGVDLNATVFNYTVYPGEEAHYWFKVKNTGNAEDFINLTGTVVEPLEGWVFNFSTPDVLVQPFQDQIIILKVTPPLKTRIGIYDLKIIGRVFDQPLEDSIVLQTNISRTYGIDFTSVENLSKSYYPGENFTYNLYAINDGNDWDKLQISIQRAPKTWLILLSKTKPFMVDAFSKKKNQLFFEIPNQTKMGTYLIRLRAVLVNNESIWAELDIQINVKRIYGLNTSLDITEASVKPGVTVLFNLTLNHLGNAEDTVEVQVLNKPRDWYVNISNNQLTVASFSDYLVPIEITPNSKAVVNKYPLQLKIVLIGSGETNIYGLNITVEPIYGFEVVCLKNMYTVTPGDAQNFNLYLTNYGNHDDEITLNITNVPSDWSVTWTPQTLPAQNIILEPFNSTIISLKIATQVKAFAGTYSIPIGGMLKSTGEETTVFVYLTLTPFYGLSLESEDLQVRTTPGELFSITINITNDGNIRDNITRTIDGIPASWEIYSAKDFTYPYLGPYETKKEIIQILVPEDEQERELNITIRIRSGSKPELDDQTRSIVYVEAASESEPVRRFNWNDLQGLFFFWILPIILIIIIIIVMAVVINKQRKEHKEDMQIIKEMQEKEDAQLLEEGFEDIFVRPGEGTPSITGAMPTEPSATRKKRRTHPRPPRASELKTTHLKTRKGKKDKAKWLDKEAELPQVPITLGKSPHKKMDDESPKIKCTSCGKMINLDDYKCPYCGEVFEDFDEGEEKEKTESEDYEIHLPGEEEEDVEFEFDDEVEELEPDEDTEDEDIVWEMDEE